MAMVLVALFMVLPAFSAVALNANIRDVPASLPNTLAVEMGSSRDGGIPRVFEEVDVLDYNISAQLLPGIGEINATVLMTMKAQKSLTNVTVRLYPTLNLTSVVNDTAGSQTYNRTGTANDFVQVHLTTTVPAFTVFNLTFKYNGSIDDIYSGNLYFQRIAWTDAYGNPGDGWFPTTDIYEDRYNFTVALNVTSNWTAVASGDYVSNLTTGGGAYKVWNYRSHFPTTQITFCAANYTRIVKRTYSGVAVTLYTLSDNDTKNDALLTKVQTVLVHYVAMYGAFPFPALAIGHKAADTTNEEMTQGMWSVGDQWVSTTVTAKDVARSLAEQYFLHGLIPTRANGRIDPWLYEGFAEYSVILFELQVDGKNAELKSAKGSYTSYIYYNPAVKKEDTKTITGTQFDGTFSSETIYKYKGAYVLHMLRKVVGNTTFDTIMKDYVTNNLGSTVNAAWFRGHANTTAPGKDLDGFFATWLDTGYLLDYAAVGAVNYTKDGSWKLDVDIANTADVKGMPMDLTIEYYWTKVALTDVWNGSTQSTTLTLPINQSPYDVQLDPEGWLLDVYGGNDKLPTKPPVENDIKANPINFLPFGNPIEGDSIKIQSSMVNNVNASFSNVNASFYDNTTLLGNVTVASLGPKASIPIEITWVAAGVGNHTFKVWVDSNRTVREVDEDNNNKTADLVVNAVVPFSDLVFNSGFHLVKEQPSEGEDVEISINLTNTGPTRGFANIVVTFNLDNGTLSEETVGVLNAKETTTVTTILMGATKGHHFLEAIIDEKGLLKSSDLNRTNNAKNDTFHVNEKPIARLDVAPVEGGDLILTGMDVKLSGNMSTDDVRIVEYIFDPGDGTTPEWGPNAVLIHKYMTPGDYTASLIVKDDIGIDSIADTPLCQVDLTVGSRAPTANFTISPEGASGDVYTTFTFTSTSTDQDGLIANFKWIVHEDPKVVESGQTLNMFTHKFANHGTFDVELVVTDNTQPAGLSANISRQVTITNLAPYADFTATPEQPRVGEEMTLDSQAKDPENQKLTYSWSIKGKGMSEALVLSGKTVKHTFTEQDVGDATVTLTVMDDMGLTDSQDKTITVKATTTPPDGDKDNDKGMGMYLYIGIAIAAVVLILIVLVVTGVIGKKKTVEEEDPWARRSREYKQAQAAKAGKGKKKMVKKGAAVPAKVSKEEEDEEEEKDEAEVKSSSTGPYWFDS